MESNLSFTMPMFYGSIAVFLLLFPASVGAYRRYLGISFGAASCLWLAALGLTIVSKPSALHSSFASAQSPGIPSPLAFMLRDFYLPRMALWLATVPFVVKLFLKWVHNKVTAPEQKPGMEGVRAWLGGGNLVAAMLMAFAAYLNNVPFMSVFVLAILALLAYPVLKTVTQPIGRSEAVWEDLSVEREKVLSLLEQGKITADEAGELLAALGQITRPRTVFDGTSTGSFASDCERWMTIGLGIVTIGAVLTVLNIPGIMRGGAGLSGNSRDNLTSLFSVMICALTSISGAKSGNRLRTALSVGLLGTGIFQLILIIFRSLPYPEVGVILMSAGYVLLFLGLGRQLQINEAEKRAAAQPPKV